MTERSIQIIADTKQRTIDHYYFLKLNFIFLSEKKTKLHIKLKDILLQNGLTIELDKAFSLAYVQRTSSASLRY